MTPDPVTAQRHRLGRGFLIVVLALALVLTAVFALLWRQAVAELTALEGHEVNLVGEAEVAMEAAAAAITNMTTYHHASTAEDFAWVDTAATTDYQAQFAEVSQPLRELVEEFKIRSEGVVVATGANVIDEDTIEVLVFVDQRITNELADGEVLLEQPRILATMVREGTTWLVNDVELYNRTGAAPFPEAATE